MSGKEPTMTQQTRAAGVPEQGCRFSKAWIGRCGNMQAPPIPDPVVTQRERGGWLAVSRPGERLRLGVVATDEQSARDTFARSAGRWIELCEAAMMRDAMADEQTQKTQPKTDAEPVDIPVPTRERVFGDLRKVAPPVEQRTNADDED